MKILCVVTGEALIDGRRMDGVGEGRGWGAVQDMMVKVLPVLATKRFSGSLISIRQVLFSSRWLTVGFHSYKALLVCVWRAHSQPFAGFPLKVCQHMKENLPQHLDRAR